MVMLASLYVRMCCQQVLIPMQPVISSLVAEHTTLYPLGNTVVTCSASSPDGAALKYQLGV